MFETLSHRHFQRRNSKEYVVLPFAFERHHPFPYFRCSVWWTRLAIDTTNDCSNMQTNKKSVIVNCRWKRRNGVADLHVLIRFYSRRLNGQYTLDNIASCLFGIETNSVENDRSEFIHYLKKFFTISFTNLFLLVFRKSIFFLLQTFFYQSLMKKSLFAAACQLFGKERLHLSPVGRHRLRVESGRWCYRSTSWSDGETKRFYTNDDWSRRRGRQWRTTSWREEK